MTSLLDNWEPNDWNVCFVCLYRQTFADAFAYEVNPAIWKGQSLTFELCIIPVCHEHVGWILDDPEAAGTLELLDLDTGGGACIQLEI